jgi:hypothetical protein
VEVASGQVRQRLEGHQSYVASLAFAPDGRTLASGSADTTALVWDLRGVPGEGRPSSGAGADLNRLWDDLADSDAARADEALRALAASPESAVPFLKKRLSPTKSVDAERIKRLIADLDSEEFTVRQKAGRELEQFGELAEPLLRDAEAGEMSREARRRLEQVINKLHEAVPSTKALRALRAVEALEWIGTSEARQLLQGLAKGAPEAQLTQEAKASLERLAKRPTAKP